MAIKTENLITWGLLGLIAYELWQSNRGPGLGLTSDVADTNIPRWVQQLSNVERQDYIQQMNYTQLTNQITDNLLSIPQGPGGGYPLQPIPDDYFIPTSGIFGLCK